jgi:hypothetical protein
LPEDHAHDRPDDEGDADAVEQRDDGRWTIVLEPRLRLVRPRAKRAHQGWRYLEDRDAPQDLPEGEQAGDALPGRLIRKLASLGLD